MKERELIKYTYACYTSIEWYESGKIFLSESNKSLIDHYAVLLV